jgi:hypothetical protein
MRGFIHDPEGTAEAIDADGWLHTGDIAVMDTGGNIVITDRMKDMFIVGGFNAYPAEIEGMMLEHPALSQVAIVGTLVASALVCVASLFLAEPLARGFSDDPDQIPMFVELFRLGILYVPLFALMQVLRYCTQAYKTMVPSVVAGTIVQPAARFIIGTGALVAGFAIAGAVSSLVMSVAIGAVGVESTAACRRGRLRALLLLPA